MSFFWKSKRIFAYIISCILSAPLWGIISPILQMDDQKQGGYLTSKVSCMFQPLNHPVGGIKGPPSLLNCLSTHTSPRACINLSLQLWITSWCFIFSFMVNQSFPSFFPTLLSFPVPHKHYPLAWHSVRFYRLVREQGNKAGNYHMVGSACSGCFPRQEA